MTDKKKMQLVSVLLLLCELVCWFGPGSSFEKEEQNR